MKRSPDSFGPVIGPDSGLYAPPPGKIDPYKDMGIGGIIRLTLYIPDIIERILGGRRDMSKGRIKGQFGALVSRFTNGVAMLTLD